MWGILDVLRFWLSDPTEQTGHSTLTRSGEREQSCIVLFWSTTQRVSFKIVDKVLLVSVCANEDYTYTILRKLLKVVVKLGITAEWAISLSSQRRQTQG